MAPNIEGVSKFAQDYRAELRRRIAAARPGSDYDWPDKSDAAVEKCLRAMFQAGLRGEVAPSANPALLAVCKRHGFTTREGLTGFLRGTP